MRSAFTLLSFFFAPGGDNTNRSHSPTLEEEYERLRQQHERLVIEQAELSEENAQLEAEIRVIHAETHAARQAAALANELCLRLRAEVERLRNEYLELHGSFPLSRSAQEGEEGRQSGT